MRSGGVHRKEDVGISNDNAGEKPAHRKTKVSSAMLVSWGLVGPKAYPKGKVDGQQVNIPVLLLIVMEWRSDESTAYWRNSTLKEVGISMDVKCTVDAEIR